MDIQRFGDNDTLSTAAELTIQWRYNQDNTKKFKIKVPEPKTTITEGTIKSTMNGIQQNSLFIDESTNSTVNASSWTPDTSYAKTTVTRILDLS